MNRPHLRVARPTDDLDALVAMYRDGLGFDVLSTFRDHEGFDGATLGQPGGGYHLEFTADRAHPAGRAPSADHLLVFYLPDPSAWRAACARMAAAGFERVPSHNPYWDQRGATYEDLDGYRVVLENASWERQASEG